VEFALVLPVLLILLFGIIDFGRMLNAKVTLNEAAREGARAAALRNSVSEAEAVAGQITQGIGGPTDPDVDSTCSSPSTRNAVFRISHTFRFVTPVGFFIGAGGTVTLSARGVMPCLH
jgi:hypothetical protein